jgi:hypothetical protein
MLRVGGFGYGLNLEWESNCEGSDIFGEDIL